MTSTFAGESRGPARGLFSWLPSGVLPLMKEVLRHILRRPVVGIAAAAHTGDGRWLLVRRGDTGTWALPGGTLEWGETLTHALHRELKEEAGVGRFAVERVVGVYSRPDRDPRFHAVTVVVRVAIDGHGTAMNPLEITDVKLFPEDGLPHPLALDMSDMLEAALRGGDAGIE